jgi:hypothetical protein
VRMTHRAKEFPDAIVSRSTPASHGKARSSSPRGFETQPMTSGLPTVNAQARLVGHTPMLAEMQKLRTAYGTSLSSSGRSTTLSCSFGSVRAPTATAGDLPRLTATWGTPAGM